MIKGFETITADLSNDELSLVPVVVKGLITKYGGANSHMAIRAIEQKIPAVIGVGEVMYQKWVEAQEIEIDCANKLVRVIK